VISPAIWLSQQTQDRSSLKKEQLPMDASFSSLERNILQAKGISASQLLALEAVGVASKADFAVVGDAHTLLQLLPELAPALAGEIIAWALGQSSASNITSNATIPTAIPTIVVESADAIYCLHCGSKQPHDYKSGDLCPNCGLQAEPTRSCYWCSNSGPGKFCRNCGAEFVATAELELALLLKREGQPKDEIPRRLRLLSDEEKAALWGRLRRGR
jgi:hypothetical protein